MESRKIVKSGNTSFTIALPIHWIRRNGLKAGDLVSLWQNPQGDLVINIPERSEPIKGEDVTVIRVEGKDAETLSIELLIAYLRDSSQIVIEGKDYFTVAERVIKYMKEYIGLDIMEESENGIVIKNFFTLEKGTAPRDLIRRLDVIVRAEFTLLEQMEKSGTTKEELLQLQKYHEQTKRLHMLVRKTLMKLINQPGLMKSVRTSAFQLLSDKIVAQVLYYCSASLSRIGKPFLYVDMRNSNIATYRKTLKEIRKEYERVISSYMNRDQESAQRFLKRYSTLTRELERHLDSIEDPLLMQASNSLRWLFYTLKSVAYETLT